MCGIFCCLERESSEIEEGIEVTNEKQNDMNYCTLNNARRGPDTSASLFHDIRINKKKWIGQFCGYVLWTQGTKIINQPHTEVTGNVLLWNGDIFSGNLADTEISDTKKLYSALEKTNNVIETLKSIQGPFSFIYFEKSTDSLYFGRDFIGRHSLLMKLHKDHKYLIISSVASKKLENFIEVPAFGIFMVNIKRDYLNFTLYPWRKQIESSNIMKIHLPINIEVMSPIIPPEFNDTPITIPETEDLPYLKIITGTKTFEEAMMRLIENPLISTRINEILRLLRDSVKLRIEKKPNYCKNCIKFRDELPKCLHAKVALLFSGGLDSTILAAIAHEFIPESESIDLINVAFERAQRENHFKNNNKKIKEGDNNRDEKFQVPDRKTGQQSLEELRKLFPKRKWNFIETNVTLKELDECRRKWICHVIFPLRTILDESLGCALWFAARGIGTLSDTGEHYESPCRILLLGMGADELFGGYTRHRNTLKHKGWLTLSQELDVELARISERNLGRDDRIVSDHGKQSRLPYLDDNFIKYVTNLKAWEKCCPVEQMPPGLGDKMLLRLAAFKIGLTKTSTFPKRAFQFGSRIANSRENAKDLSKWL